MKHCRINRVWVWGMVLAAGLWGGGGAMAQFKDFGAKAPEFGNQENVPKETGRGGYEVETNNPLLLIFPALRGAPSPKWVKPGLRLTFFSADATVPGGDIAGLVQDHRGQWFDPATGQTYRVEQNRGSYGEGYNQLDVVSLTDDAVVVSLRSYLIDLLGGPIRLVKASGFTSMPGAAADWWMNPQVLNQTVDQLKGPGVQSMRTTFKTAGNEYDAVWITTKTASGNVSSIIDLASGLTLNYSSSYKTGPDGMTQLGDVPTRIGGGTHLARTTFVGMREIKAPWIGMAMPKSIDGVDQLVYEGEMSSTMLGNTVSMPMKVIYDITGRGLDFVQLKKTNITDLQNGTPPQESVVKQVNGVNQLLPICIPPGALAKLRNGQVIDKDPFTKITTFVSFIGQDQSGNDVVTLTEYISEKDFRTDLVYDMRGGILIASQMTDPQLNMQITFHRVR
ncbi:MAG: hypothetical protein IT447_07780 [Phycisphaerales bacterium]|jgi:hypothetical protein|nr:hypothetical protein [Phycisphaerales bacterium]